MQRTGINEVDCKPGIFLINWSQSLEFAEDHALRVRLLRKGTIAPITLFLYMRVRRKHAGKTADHVVSAK
jgi:hypothetical protein